MVATDGRQDGPEQPREYGAAYVGAGGHEERRRVAYGPSLPWRRLASARLARSDCGKRKECGVAHEEADGHQERDFPVVTILALARKARAAGGNAAASPDGLKITKTTARLCSPEVGRKNIG